MVLIPITRRQILDSSKLKEFAEDNSKFDENGRKLSIWVKNTVGKGDIASYEQFLLFPWCFQKACFPGASKGVIVWEWVKTLWKGNGAVLKSSIQRQLTHYQTTKFRLFQTERVCRRQFQI